MLFYESLKQTGDITCMCSVYQASPRGGVEGPGNKAMFMDDLQSHSQFTFTISVLYHVHSPVCIHIHKPIKLLHEELKMAKCMDQTFSSATILSYSWCMGGFQQGHSMSD